MSLSPGSLVFPPVSPNPHTHTIIFLHGRGDTARNFSRSLAYSRTSSNQQLAAALPQTIRWVFPSSALRPVSNSPSLALTSQWFDVWNVADFSDREDLQAEGLRESVDQIRRLIVEEVKLLGGRSERVVLMGISQGAAVSVHTLLNLNLDSIFGDGDQKLGIGRGLGAFVGFSCRMPFPGRSLSEMRGILGLQGVPTGDQNEVLKNTPMLLEHCVDDPLVLIGYGKVLKETLTKYGANVEWKEYESGGHWFNSPKGMDDVVEFLRTNVFEVAQSTEQDKKGAEGDISMAL